MRTRIRRRNAAHSRARPGRSATARAVGLSGRAAEENAGIIWWSPRAGAPIPGWSLMCT